MVDYLRKVGHQIDVVDVYQSNEKINDFEGSRIQGVAVDENEIITAYNDWWKTGEVQGLWIYCILQLKHTLSGFLYCSLCFEVDYWMLELST